MKSTIVVTVLYQAAPPFVGLPYNEGDPLRVVCRYGRHYEDRDILHTLRTAFNVHQDMDLDMYCRDVCGRSIAVGDVIAIGEQFYAVENVGFKQVRVDREQIVEEDSELEVPVV